MTDRAVDVSVVICAYTEERWDHLLQAIESVERQSTRPRELIVAIDHNARLRSRLEATGKDVRIIDSSGPKGKSGALNTAIAAAHGSVIALLDDDAAAEPTWLAELVRGYEDDDVLGVGGYLEPVWPGRRPSWFPEEFLWVLGCTYRGMPRDRAIVRNLIGANMSFRRDVFLEAGGSRDGLGPNGTALVGAARAEDTEFCIRASARWPDRVWVYEPRARARHHVPASRARWSYFSSRCYVEGLSKALLADVAGVRDGLAAERRYTFVTLPLGVLRGFGEAIFRLDPGGIARSAAIVAGLAITTAGYVRGAMALRRSVATST
jgi:glycosyltransferase involved in cell wall biosynthesis